MKLLHIPLLLACAVLPAASVAQIARDEIHVFGSLTASENDFLANKRGTTTVTIAGDLRIPRPGNGKLPVVIVLHGTGGIGGSITDWERELNVMGIATFRIDSYSGRGLTTTFADQDQFGRLNLMFDAWRAFELLEKHPRVDPDRIALMGFSLGGQATLVAAAKRFQSMYGAASGREFAAYVPFYPQCNIRYKHDDVLSQRPVRIFHGEADDWAPIAPCRTYAEQAQKKGADLTLTEYPNAHHVFDWPALAPPVRVQVAQAIKGCTVVEGDTGRLVSAATGQPFTWKDPCVERGATVGYDEAAFTASRKAVKEFLALTLKP
jgi:dienelactone hydrolase